MDDPADSVELGALRAEVATLKLLLDVHERLTRTQMLALRNSEERHRTTLMSVGDGVITTDDQGRVEMMNHEAERLTGWDQADAVGQDIEALFPVVCESTGATVENPIRRVLRDGVVVGLTNHTMLIARDGKAHPIANSGAPIRQENGAITGVVLVFRDQTAERVAEAALLASRERFRELVENLNEVVYTTTDAGILTYLSPVVQAMLGYAADELVGKPLVGLVHPDDLAKVRQAFADTLAGRIQSCEFRSLAKDGRLLWVRTSNRQQRVDGRVVGIQGSMVDITAYKQVVEAQIEGVRRYRTLYMDSRDAIMVLSLEQGFVAGNPATIRLFGCRDEREFTTCSPATLSPERQPDGALSSDKAAAMMRLAMERGSHAFEWTHRRMDGSDFPATVLLSRCDIGGKLMLQATVRDLTEEKRKAERLVASHAEAELLLATVSAALIGLDAQDRISRWNTAAERVFGRTSAEVIGKTIDESGIHCEWVDLFLAIKRCTETRQPQVINELRYERPQGGDGYLTVTVDASQGSGSERLELVLLARDITEQRIFAAQQQQRSKLESIGQLASGIAHEINTPIQFIGDNLSFLADANSCMDVLYRAHAQFIATLRERIPAEQLTAIDEADRTADPEYLFSEVPKAIRQSQEGVERVVSIVRAMKEFSHPDQGRLKEQHDINRALRTMLTVARNEYKYVAEARVELDESLPLVPCFLGEINQVFLNLLVNAAHAIGDVVKDSKRLGVIRIASRRDGEWVEVAISDTGAGVPANLRHRLFQPFFTTKPVGKGTGQGLYLSYMIVVQNHHGELTYAPRDGGGSVMTVRLPLVAARPETIKP